MKNELYDEQSTKSAAAYPTKAIIVPVIAFILSLPVVLIFFGALLWRLPGFVVLLLILSPIAGAVMGIISLTLGRKRIGIAGIGLAILAILLPVSIVLLILIFFIGISTGLISLM